MSSQAHDHRDRPDHEDRDEQRRPQGPAGIALGHGDGGGDQCGPEHAGSDDRDQVRDPGGGFGDVADGEHAQQRNRRADLDDGEADVECDLGAGIPLGQDDEADGDRPGDRGPCTPHRDHGHDEGQFAGGPGEALLAELEVDAEGLRCQQAQEDRDQQGYVGGLGRRHQDPQRDGHGDGKADPGRSPLAAEDQRPIRRAVVVLGHSNLHFPWEDGRAEANSGREQDNASPRFRGARSYHARVAP